MTGKKIKGKCILCGAELNAPLFTLNDAPAGAYTMPRADELTTDHGITLPLSRCPRCGLVELDTEPVGYYRDVKRAVGLSGTMRDLRRADFNLLIDKYGCGGKKWVEIGAGNGDFLRVLSEFPVDVYGTEHDPHNVSAARAALREAYSAESGGTDAGAGEAAGHTGSGGTDSSIHNEPQGAWSGGTDMDTHIMEWFPEDGGEPIPGAPYDVFLSFNFLEHQPDPVGMLVSAHRSLKPGGIGLITVPSFEYIAKCGRFYELVRDHIANYDLRSLRNLVELSGFSVVEEGFIGIGDTLRMVVRKDDHLGRPGSRGAGLIGSAGAPGGSKTDELAGNPAGAFGDPQGDKLAESFRDGYYEYTARIEEFVNDVTGSGRSIAMWGAGHQGFTVAAATALNGSVRYIIDSSPAKQGRFAPASHIPIVAPSYFAEDPVDVILISAPGYVGEIEVNIRSLYGSVSVADITDLHVR